MSQSQAEAPTLFGHPPALFTLFFAEMWERFSFYGMRALLTLYLIKGFLGYNDDEAYKVYGAYTSLVYMTPFFGGLLADRLLGSRRAVIFGGLLMAAGHLLMMLEYVAPFYVALALLIAGNGFFKPNISTIVGGLYPPGSTQRDGGFTIFYMGVNLGAALAPLVCGYVGETYGWHYGFGLATFGMLAGLAVFVAPTLVAQLLILGGAIGTAISMLFFQDGIPQLIVNILIGGALVAAAGVAWRALSMGGIPPEAGGPRDPELLKRPLIGPITNEFAVYLGTLTLVPAVAWLTWSVLNIRLIPQSTLDGLLGKLDAAGKIIEHAPPPGKGVELAVALLSEVATLPGILLSVTGILAFGYLFLESMRSEKVARERLWVALVMMFFSMLFWAFFEQAGSSISNFTDRNVDRVTETRLVAASEVGTTLKITATQEQLGYNIGGKPFTLDLLDKVRKEAKEKGVTPELEVVVAQEHVGMGVATSELPASVFQAANPLFIISFGLLFTVMWGALKKYNLEPSTPVKFALGLTQLALGFAVLWYGAQSHDARGMVGVSWLLIAYLLHTTGELCLSPVGLSMITWLSPARLVSTAMGAWFLATAFSQFLAAVIATLTGVSHGGGDSNTIPVPLETVNVYGGVFGQIGMVAGVAALLAFAVSPLLRKWTHEGVGQEPAAGGH